MSQVRYVRTTHENGRFLPFPTQAYQFWREYGWIVGEVLRLEQGMTFAEIVVACEEYLLEHPESALLLPAEEPHFAWCLIKLLELGMARVVTEPGDSTKVV